MVHRSEHWRRCINRQVPSSSRCFHTKELSLADQKFLDCVMQEHMAAACSMAAYPRRQASVGDLQQSPCALCHINLGHFLRDLFLSLKSKTDRSTSIVAMDWHKKCLAFEFNGFTELYITCNRQCAWSWH